nr:MAG TPA: hypothetical protein [Caudoviricetes sp.]
MAIFFSFRNLLYLLYSFIPLHIVIKHSILC